MTIEFLQEQENNWVCYANDGIELYFTGQIWKGDESFCGEKACLRIKDLLTSVLDGPSAEQEQGATDVLQQLSGQFAFVFRSRSFCLAAVDKIRSYPIFYAKTPDGFCVAPSALFLQNEKKLWDRDEDSFLAFNMSGYAPGRSTLYRGLLQLQAGECLLVRSGQEERTIRYFEYFPREIDSRTEESLVEELVHVSRSVFRDLAARLAGRPVWVPLSAGLDSRFVLAMLKDAGYDNIQSFFYGPPGDENWEGKYSRQLAEQLNVPWLRIEYSLPFLREVFRSPSWRAFGNFAGQLSSVPGYNMIYRLEWLKRKNCVPDDAVFINGQTGDFISGNHLGEVVSRDQVFSEDVLQAILDKNFSLWADLKTDENVERIKGAIKTTYPDWENLQTAQCAAGYLDRWEWSERQAKYVVNGQRGYEFFGFDWELPLWDDLFLMFWREVPWTLKFQQKLFRRFLVQFDPCGAFKDYDPDRRPPLLKGAVARTASLLLKPFPSSFQEGMKKTFLVRYMDPFWVHRVLPWREYMRRARFHRNMISYYSLEYLNGLKDVRQQVEGV